MTDPTAVDQVARMYDALNAHVIAGQEEFWSEEMVWHGPAGIGTMATLDEFKRIYQRNCFHAFPDKYAEDEIRFGDGGDWAAAHGYQYATHLGEYLGIPATGKQVKIRYMDIWRSEGDKLVENWVLIDLIDFCQQIGIDVLQLVRDQIANGTLQLDVHTEVLERAAREDIVAREEARALDSNRS